MKFALLGENIGYSLSPEIHNIIYKSIGLEAEYELVSVSLDGLGEALEKLRDYDGFNVTKPYKQTIMPYLENLDEVKNGKIQAVNTVCVKKGLFYGYNTDVFGFSRSIDDWNFSSALVVGAGGVANAVVDSLSCRPGAKIYITNRTIEKAELVAKEFGIKSIKISSLARHFFDLVVNCTSVGNNGEMSLPREVDLSKTRYAYDTIYSPPRTAFLEMCERQNIEIRNGLAMLIYQAIRADEIFLGETFGREKLYNLIMEKLGN